MGGRHGFRVTNWVMVMRVTGYGLRMGIRGYGLGGRRGIAVACIWGYRMRMPMVGWPYVM